MKAWALRQPAWRPTNEASPINKPVKSVMKKSTLLSVIIAAATSVANAAVWNVDYNVDPETGWLSNGVVIEAINLGPSDTSPYLYVEPVTVNGISFGTNAVLTTNWGGAYSSDFDSRYSGGDPALQNLYYTYRVVNSWTLGSSASFRFSNLIPGRVYQAQFNSGAQWDWAALNLYATADSGSNTLYQYLGTSPAASVVCRSLYTWEATTNSITGETNYAEVNMYPNGTTECRVFGYTLRDISYGPPAVYENSSVSPGTNVYAGSALTFDVRSAGALPLSYQWRKGGINIDGATSRTYLIASSLTDDSGSYDVVITNGEGSATSGPISVTVNPANPPTITTNPPVAPTRLQYGQINLVAAASGSTPMLWQWKFDGSNIPGATNASLLLKDLGLNQAGVYQAFVTNQFGWTNSATCTLSLTRNLVRNGHFGTAQDAANFGLTSTDHWIMAAPGNWNTPTVQPDGTSSMGTCARINGNWNAIVQDTTETYQPNTLYTVTLQARGANALTVQLLDASDSYPTNWVTLASRYLWIGNNTVYNAKTYDFSTLLDLSTNVGKKIGIKLRHEQSGGAANMSISQVRLNAFGPAVLGNVQKPGATQASFTINSWPGQTNEVWASTDLLNWSFLDNVTNVSGADTFIDNTATAPKRFYQIR